MKKQKALAYIFAVAVMLGGCSAEKQLEDTMPLPEDKPYNRIIMETDSGYYYNVDDQVLSLRYTEKSTGADIFLCSKPECMHNGNDTCTATYNYLITSNYVLYDNFIYFVADIRDGETLGYALYKASLDGTSLDKVGDVKKIKAPLSVNGYNSLDKFIIHKGYAYIPYKLGNHSYGEFIESGFVRMNISTGEAETIFSETDFFSAVSTDVYAGCGDYIYYRTWCSSASDKTGDFRYNIADGSHTRFYDVEDGNIAVTCVSDRAFYVMSTDEDKVLRLTGYDANTLKANDFEITLADDPIYDFIAYKNYVIVCQTGRVTIYDDKGAEVGSLSFDDSEQEDSQGTATFIYNAGRFFDISDEKLYMGRWDTDNNKTIMYSCPINDIIAGEGQWKEAYSINSWENYCEENPIITKLNRGQ